MRKRVFCTLFLFLFYKKLHIKYVTKNKKNGGFNMSDRTMINDFQIFGNNETYPEWLDFLKTKGIEIDEEGHYEGEIDDFMGMLSTIEKISMNIEENRRKEIDKLKKEERIKGTDDYFNAVLHNEESRFFKSSTFDFRKIYTDTKRDMENNDEHSSSLFDCLCEIINNGYMFFSYAAYKACEKDLEKCDLFSTPKHFRCYKLKEGHKIKVSCR